MGVSFLATSRGLPTPPARGLTSMFEPGGKVLRSSSAMVAPYTYQALPVSSVAKARLTGACGWAHASRRGSLVMRAMARSGMTAKAVIVGLRVRLLTNRPPAGGGRFAARRGAGARRTRRRVNLRRATASMADGSRGPVYATGPRHRTTSCAAGPLQSGLDCRPRMSCRARRGKASQPVLGREPWYASEVLGVVGHEPQPQREGARCHEDVECSHRCAPPGQCCREGREAVRSPLIEGSHLHGLDE